MAAQEPSSLVKVKGLISQMVEKLMAEANAEASQKAFYDKEKAKSSTPKEEKYVSSCGGCPIHYMILTVVDSFEFILVPKHIKIGRN